jgi:hypothetical protein
MNKNFRLTPDQFQIDEQGRLFISHDEISEGLRRQEPAELTAAEEGAVTVTVKISF